MFLIIVTGKFSHIAIAKRNEAIKKKTRRKHWSPQTFCLLENQHRNLLATLLHYSVNVKKGESTLY